MVYQIKNKNEVNTEKSHEHAKEETKHAHTEAVIHHEPKVAEEVSKIHEPVVEKKPERRKSQSPAKQPEKKVDQPVPV